MKKAIIICYLLAMLYVVLNKHYFMVGLITCTYGLSYYVLHKKGY